MAENKGNPYHDEEGKFTSGDKNRLDSKEKNPFKKKGLAPVNEDELSSSWMDLFGLGQKIIDEHKKEEEPKKKIYYAGTLNGDTWEDEPIEAESEEEAYRIAEMKHPGYGDELTVYEEEEDAEDKLNKMGFEGEDE